MRMSSIQWKMVRENFPLYPLSGSGDVFNFAKDILNLHEKDREHLVVLLLNNRKEIFGYETVSVGILNGSLVHAREIFKPAMIGSAQSIILVHNHPSGNSEPSLEDKMITAKLSEVGKKIVDIPITDHVIVGHGNYFSFLDEGAFL